METVSASKFKATCLELLRKVKATGQPVLITRKGEPIAQLVPPPPRELEPGWLGQAQGSGRILGDLLEPLDIEWEANL